MNESKTYLWKELNIGKKYTLISDVSPCTIPNTNIDNRFILSFYDISMGWDNFISDFLDNYEAITFPVTIKKLIDDLLEFQKIEDKNNEFYYLACIFQKVYISLKDSSRNVRYSDIKSFQDESIDLKLLLNILHDYLSNSPSKVKSISFKKNSPKRIENFFIINDILRILAEGYNLTLNNFENRKKELLNNTNNVKFDLLDEFYKYYFSLSLYKYISNEIAIDYKFLNAHLKFVTQFLHISQIPINKTYFEVPKSLMLDDFCSPDDLKYLRSFISRPKSFFIK